MAYSTSKAILLDRLHDQAAARETAFIAAQFAGIPTSRLLCVADILTTYTFTPDPLRTLKNADGKTIQAAMRVQHPANPADRFLVTCSVETGEEAWAVQCPPFKQHYGALFIEATQLRVANQSIARRVQEGN